MTCKPSLRRRGVLAYSLAHLALLASCSGKSGVTAADLQNPEARAPEAVEASLRADTSKRLNIQKASLGKEFLFHGSFAPQERNATSRGLKARVITFHRSEGSVFVLESTEGRLVSDDVPTRIILAELPILSESDNALVVDFNAGMKSVFTLGSLHASDVHGTAYENGDKISRVAMSFIDSIRIRDNSVEIRQIARVDEPSGAGGEVARSYEIRYYLTPYRPTEGFVARETSDLRRVGYFETQPALERRTGNLKIRITRRDENKVFTYSISSNTPADKVDAIRDGVLYWNKVFGREVVRVDMAPPGVTAPDSRYNIIQWVEDRSIASAYADVLNDPRTGEILHSQIFLHSGLFAKNGPSLVGLLRRLNRAAEQPAEGSEVPHADFAPASTQKQPKFKLKGLTADRLCDMDEAQVFGSDSLSLLAASDQITPEMYERLSNNYITYALAHEVGHTLGLRHNFAGSLATQVGLTERDSTMLKYLKTGEVPADLVLSSSVMEYAQFTDSTLIGAQIRAGNTVLPYDQLAIDWGYRGAELPLESPLFCSDGDTLAFADCKRYDTGTDAVAANAERINLLRRALPIMTVEEFIRAKTDPKANNSFNPVTLLTPLMETLTDQVGWLTNMTRYSVQIDRSFSDDPNALKYQALWVNGQVEKSGGVDQLLFAHLPATDRPAVSLFEIGAEELDTYLSRAEVLKGIGYDGKPYQLNEEEIEEIRTGGKDLLKGLDQVLRSQLLKLYGQAPLATLYTGAIETRLGSIAEELILRQKPVDETTPNTGGAAVKPAAPRGFVYPDNDRLAAASLLVAKSRPTGFGEPQRLQLIDGLRAIIKAELGSDVHQVKVRELGPQQRQWFNVQRRLVQALEKAGRTE